MRYIIAFLLPITAATLLFYVTSDMRLEASRLSAEFINLAISQDADAQTEALSLALDGAPQVFHRINVATIGTMMLVAGITALCVPPSYSIARKCNMMAAMTLGFCVAQIVVRFSFLDWWRFGQWMLVCLGLFAFLVWVLTTVRSARSGSA